jgi:putative endonuclease
MRSERQAADRRGRTGETAAAWWLRLKGWRILDGACARRSARST